MEGGIALLVTSYTPLTHQERSPNLRPTWSVHRLNATPI